MATSDNQEQQVQQPLELESAEAASANQEVITEADWAAIVREAVGSESAGYDPQQWPDFPDDADDGDELDGDMQSEDSATEAEDLGWGDVGPDVQGPDLQQAQGANGELTDEQLDQIIMDQQPESWLDVDLMRLVRDLSPELYEHIISDENNTDLIIQEGDAELAAPAGAANPKPAAPSVVPDNRAGQNPGGPGSVLGAIADRIRQGSQQKQMAAARLADIKAATTEAQPIAPRELTGMERQAIESIKELNMLAQMYKNADQANDDREKSEALHKLSGLIGALRETVLNATSGEHSSLEGMVAGIRATKILQDGVKQVLNNPAVGKSPFGQDLHKGMEIGGGAILNGIRDAVKSLLSTGGDFLRQLGGRAAQSGQEPEQTQQAQRARLAPTPGASPSMG